LDHVVCLDQQDLLVKEVLGESGARPDPSVPSENRDHLVGGECLDPMVLVGLRVRAVIVECRDRLDQKESQETLVDLAFLVCKDCEVPPGDEDPGDQEELWGKLANLGLMAKMGMQGHKDCRDFRDPWEHLETRGQLENKDRRETPGCLVHLGLGVTRVKMGFLDKGEQLVHLGQLVIEGHRDPRDQEDSRDCLGRLERMECLEKMEKLVFKGHQG